MTSVYLDHLRTRHALGYRERHQTSHKLGWSPSSTCPWQNTPSVYPQNLNLRSQIFQDIVPALASRLRKQVDRREAAADAMAPLGVSESRAFSEAVVPRYSRWSARCVVRRCTVSVLSLKGVKIIIRDRSVWSQVAGDALPGFGFSSK